MKLFGVGTDIIQVDRLKKSLKKKIFLSRIFSEEEILKCKRKKKKMKIVLLKGLRLKKHFQKPWAQEYEIIVLNEKSGKPYIRLVDKTKKIVERKLKKKRYNISLSIADEKDYAVAFVTISI